MKRTFALLLCALLALGVSACGDDRNSTANGSGSAVTENGTADNNGTLGGVQPEANGNTMVPGPGDGASESILPDENLPGGTTDSATDGLTGKPLRPDGDLAGAADTARPSGGESAVQQSTVIHGATYGQMLRNARVHDRDGFLLDGENAVTPGTTFR